MIRVSRKYRPFSLGQLICPSCSLMSTVNLWWANLNLECHDVVLIIARDAVAARSASLQQ
jgi:hypothetical protein